MVNEITVTEAHARQQAGGVLVDVREPDEIAVIAAAGAIAVPLSEIQRLGAAAFQQAGVDPLHEGLMLICRSGARSAMVCEAIGASACNVQGGMLAWQAAGLPPRT